ncbi:MAG TPA: maleylpyruvate isomerase family mycothiol-dependent enzyme [Nocardioides sp.]|nr:maleylpyruvate isomerase family mycothiol-dependent enzyme [Nocardioides sp.]
MDRDTLWGHIHHERATLAETLRTLTPQQWEHDSLCEGWTVKDVAAHVISTPQMGFGRTMGIFARNLGRGYNTMIFRETKRLAERQTTEQILGDYVTYATSRRKVATTTTVEPLIDALVHHQDIVRPLGLRHDMDPTAAAVAADRVRALAPLMGTRRFIKGVRMVATDVDWARGQGPVAEGPMQELLMLCSGRETDLVIQT